MFEKYIQRLVASVKKIKQKLTKINKNKKNTPT